MIAGGLSWVGLVKSGIEPALALVAIVPFLPGPRTSQELSEDAHEVAILMKMARRPFQLRTLTREP
ncbi:MAG: hypothetical protein CM1200mP27_04790 [Chloroflexota bacterium]|nr:MAG: hypothetical protein CM1200mP27_04790 [Chloroflexota bacterium]